MVQIYMKKQPKCKIEKYLHGYKHIIQNIGMRKKSSRLPTDLSQCKTVLNRDAYKNIAMRHNKFIQISHQFKMDHMKKCQNEIIKSWPVFAKM